MDVQLLTVLVLCFCVFLLSVLYTSRNPRLILAAITGASAALVAAQVSSVHIFSLLAAIFAIVPGGRKPRIHILASILLVSCGLMAATVFFGDLVSSATLALQLLALCFSGLLFALRARKAEVYAAFYGMLAITTASSALALLQVTGIVSIETWHADVLSVGRPIGIYSEPDWLGMFSGIGLIVAWTLPLKGRLRVLLIVLNGASFVLAFARAAWLALAGVLVLSLIEWLVNRSRKQLLTKPRVAAASILLAGGAAVFAAVPSIASDFITRVGTMLSSSGASESDISGEARVRQISSLIDLASSAPWYGHGLSAEGRVGVFGGIIQGDDVSNHVASNWILGLWADGAFLSIPLILTLALISIWRGGNLSQRLLLFVLVNSLFSNALFFPITWFLAALAIYATFAQRTPLAEGEASEPEHRITTAVKRRNHIGSRYALGRPISGGSHQRLPGVSGPLGSG